MIKNYNQSGLTLIETALIMLVTLTAGGIITNNRINHQQMLRRDAVRKENIRLLSARLEDFKTAKQTYPSKLKDLVKYGLNTTIPVDPTTHKDYSFIANPTGCSTDLQNCLAYTLSAMLENKTDKDADPATHLMTIGGGQ